MREPIMPAGSQFAAAIANAEGFGISGAIPTRNNNPGDLKNWPGVPADPNGYSVFPSAQAGWDALQQQLDSIAAGASAYYTPEMSIAQMGQVWASGDPNWAANVAAYLGTTTNVMIGSFLGVAPAPGPAISYGPLPTMPIGPAPNIFADDDVQRALLIVGVGLGVVLLIRRFA
jgi:hypothetical protein